MEDCLFESRPNDRRKKPFTLVMSAFVHVLMVSALIVIPLMQIQAMPPVAPPPPVRLTGPQIRIVRLAAAPSGSHTPQGPTAPLQTDVFIEPTAIPMSVALIQDVPDGFDASLGNSLRIGLPYGPGSGQLGIPGVEITHGIPAAVPPPPPPLPPAPVEPKIIVREPIRISSGIQKSHLLKQVDPAYPPLAKLARVEGSVILEARITENGTIEGLRVISGNPLLVPPSVIDSVKQWRYEPTLLNGVPVEVITTITINFTLK